GGEAIVKWVSGNGYRRVNRLEPLYVQTVANGEQIMISRGICKAKRIRELRGLTGWKIISVRRAGHHLRTNGEKIAQAPARTGAVMMGVDQRAAGEILHRLDAVVRIVGDLERATQRVDDQKQTARAVVLELDLVRIP